MSLAHTCYIWLCVAQYTQSEFYNSIELNHNLSALNKSLLRDLRTASDKVEVSNGLCLCVGLCISVKNKRFKVRFFTGNSDKSEFF